jgi:hypothetical protein
MPFSYQKRTFLNPPATGATSYILAQVESTGDGENKWGGNLLIIADWTGTLNLNSALAIEHIDAEVC